MIFCQISNKIMLLSDQINYIMRYYNLPYRYELTFHFRVAVLLPPHFDIDKIRLGDSKNSNMISPYQGTMLQGIINVVKY